MTRPFAGWSIPRSRSAKVVFPAPEEPTNATTLPGFISRLKFVKKEIRRGYD
jgi:hypothetical protein